MTSARRRAQENCKIALRSHNNNPSPAAGPAAKTSAAPIGAVLVSTRKATAPQAQTGKDQYRRQVAFKRAQRRTLEGLIDGAGIGACDRHTGNDDQDRQAIRGADPAPLDKRLRALPRAEGRSRHRASGRANARDVRFLPPPHARRQVWRARLSEREYRPPRISADEGLAKKCACLNGHSNPRCRDTAQGSAEVVNNALMAGFRVVRFAPRRARDSVTTRVLAAAETVTTKTEVTPKPFARQCWRLIQQCRERRRRLPRPTTQPSPASRGRIFPRGFP